jgi:hypothetical protein
MLQFADAQYRCVEGRQNRPVLSILRPIEHARHLLGTPRAG